MDIGLETSTRRLNFGLAIQLIMEYVLNHKQIPVCVCYKGKICILLYLPRYQDQFPFYLLLLFSGFADHIWKRTKDSYY